MAQESFGDQIRAEYERQGVEVTGWHDHWIDQFEDAYDRHLEALQQEFEEIGSAMKTEREGMLNRTDPVF
jgi:hypothetical protein